MMASAWILIRCPLSPESKATNTRSNDAPDDCTMYIAGYTKGESGESSVETEGKGKGILKIVHALNVPVAVRFASLQEHAYRISPDTVRRAPSAKGRETVRCSASHMKGKLHLVFGILHEFPCRKMTTSNGFCLNVIRPSSLPRIQILHPA